MVDPNNTMECFHEAADVYGVAKATTHTQRRTGPCSVKLASPAEHSDRGPISSGLAVVEQRYRATRASNCGNVAALKHILVEPEAGP